MAEVRICFEVDFEYCEIGFIHGFESAAAADEFVELVRGATVAFEDRRSGK